MSIQAISKHETKGQLVQPGLGTTQTKPGGELRSLWVEIPGWCDLFCPYCFANTNHYDFDPSTLQVVEYERIFREFADAGGTDIGIPGSGEPFHRRPDGKQSNQDLIFRLLEVAKELGLSMTIFTTAHFIDMQMAKRLLQYDVVLLVKCNSFSPEIQNELVGKPKHLNYAKERDHALLRLMYLGFNTPAYGKNSMLGIVTSIMNKNKQELPNLLRFARRHNIIFDCDTILERGRGKSFDMAGGSPSDAEMRKIFRKLQKIDAEEFGNYWDITRSYIGTCCDRFRHHMYVTKNGDVHPCVGSVSVTLGNVRERSLLECWNNELLKIIRNHNYKGKCETCLNYLEGKCYSCLGRCTVDLSTEQLLRDGCVQTTGCWNNRPSDVHD